jgi:hypothetical protein
MEAFMDDSPRLLVWNYTIEEKAALDEFLRQIEAPPAVSIPARRGHLPLKDILHTDRTATDDFHSDEKVLLFYNIPQKGVYFLIQAFKNANLPRPIYAVVTEHSINWPFSELVEHLVEERNAVEAARRAAAAERSGA